MFQLLTDTASDLSFEYLKQNNIGYVGFTVNVDGIEYKTDIKGSLTPGHLLKLIREGKEPMTSQINVGHFLEFFKKYAKKGKPLLYLAFSSGLSGTYQSSMQAAEILKEEDPELQITIVDTKAASNGMAVLIERAIKLRDEGMDISKVATEIEEIIPRVRSLVILDNLYHLQRGGRISKTTAVVGTILNVKPMVDVDSEGKLRQIGKIRGREKALKYLVSQTIGILDTTIDQIIFISYSGDVEDAKKIKDMMLEVPTVKEVRINPLGPTIVTHTGEGTVAIFSIAKVNRE
ncbi:MAG: DegV family protein [Lactobacillales bacterium]|nr:DegV family protein [Lactobacillales bacterium]